jgi:flagellar protein FliS
MSVNPYKTYLKNEIEGATQGKLVLLLYDGAIKFLKYSVKYIEEKNIEEAHSNIMKAENILFELMSTLNMDAGEISQNLLKLYDFMVWQLIEANKDKDMQKIKAVIKLLTMLRDGWKEMLLNHSKDSEQIKDKEAVKINFAG